MILSRRLPLVGIQRLIHTTPVVDKKLPHVWVNLETHEFHKIIKYVKPDPLKAWDPRRSGDLRPLQPVDPNWLRFEYRPFGEMIDSLPEEHRKLFTVGFAPRDAGTKVLLMDSLEKTKRHKFDTKSLDYKITWSTWKIRDIQDMFITNPRLRKIGHLRATVKELVEKRKKWLRKMRIADYKRFEWIIEVLGVLYKLTPPSTRIERKTSMNVVVNMFCNELRDQKMDEYKAQLEEEKVPFLKMKLETLHAIREDEQSVGLESSVDEDICSTRQLLLELEKSHLTIHPAEINDANAELNAPTGTSVEKR